MLLDLSPTDLMHLAPIGVIGCLSAAIFLERSKSLLGTFPMKEQKYFFEKVRDLVMTDRVPEAIALCDRYPGKLISNVVKEGLINAHQPDILLEDALQIAISEAQEKAKLRTPYLATFANVSTLLGLFGTILGLIESFKAIGTLAAKDKAAALTAGISTAMNATMFGLAVAIPSMIAFAFLINRTNRLTAEIEQSAARILHIIRTRSLSGSETNKDNAPLRRVA